MNKQTTVTIISCGISAVTLLITLLGNTYKFGCIHNEAKADRVVSRVERECTEKILTIERQHREELNNKDIIINEKEKELQEWREKYLLLLNERVTQANNGP